MTFKNALLNIQIQFLTVPWVPNSCVFRQQHPFPRPTAHFFKVRFGKSKKSGETLEVFLEKIDFYFPECVRLGFILNSSLVLRATFPSDYNKPFKAVKAPVFW